MFMMFVDVCFGGWLYFSFGCLKIVIVEFVDLGYRIFEVFGKFFLVEFFLLLCNWSFLL